VFSATVNGVTSQFVKKAVELAVNGSFSIEALFSGLSAANMGVNIANALGGVFGAHLASLVITPQTPEAAVFASAGAAIGGLAGTAIATALLSGIPFVGPFVGAFLGQVVGTWAGNQIFDNDDLAAVTLGYNGGMLGITGQRLGPSGGDLGLAYSLGNSVIGTVNELLNFMGARLDPNAPVAVEVGAYNDTRNWLYAFAGGHQEFYGSQHGHHDAALARTAQSGIDQVIAQMQVTGGDVVMRRAFNASRSLPGGDGDLTQLGFDLQVAEDYRFYLDNARLINAIIAAEPDSKFAMSWVVTLQRAEELGLNRAWVDDFRGGIYANIDRYIFDKLDWAPDFDPAEPGTLLLRNLNHVVEIDDVFGPGAVRHESGTGYNDLRDFTHEGTLYSVLRVDGAAGDDWLYGHRGTDLLTGGTGNDGLYGRGGHDWVHGGEGTDVVLGEDGDDLVAGGAGDDTLWGGSGIDVLAGGDGADTVVVEGLDRLDTVIAPIDRVGWWDDTLAFGAAINPDATRFARSGVDLVITTRTALRWQQWVETGTPDSPSGYWEDFYSNPDAGKVVVEDFFLTKSGIDRFRFDRDGTVAPGNAMWEGLVAQVADGAPLLVTDYQPNGARRVVALNDDRTLYPGDDPNQPWVSIASEYDYLNRLIKETRHTVIGGALTIYGEADNIIYADRSDAAWDGLGGNDWLLGTDGRDTLNGGTGGDWLRAGDGADWLSGGAEVDNLQGEAGSDTLDGGVGGDWMYGGAGDDSYYVDEAGDVASEQAGGGTWDVVWANTNYTLPGEVEHLMLYDHGYNGTGNGLGNIIYGTSANNILSGLAGDDQLNGREGNDWLIGGDGGDALFGGDGEDWLNGDGGNDTLHGDAGADSMFAGEGADTLSGGEGNDALYGEAGHDQLYGGGGVDTMHGGVGNDSYWVDNPSDVIVEYAEPNSWDGVLSSADYTLPAEVEALILYGEARRATGNQAGNALWGASGNDLLSGLGGPDALNGFAGDDTLIGGVGADVLDGGDGFDRVSYENAGAAVRVNLTYAPDSLGDAAGDSFISIERVTGSAFGDSFFGTGGADSVAGGAGDDWFAVLAGADSFDGGDGLDTVSYAEAGPSLRVI
jgi:Ca2+-binding RTX toxin-like protein